ncbi:MAG: outer membrane protein OmpA-like peptidoglycan-associated protein [Saprospiraceae bacterium]|jgi:outer membrane protein OmpA-like peptidoglycan-associated protein
MRKTGNALLTLALIFLNFSVLTAQNVILEGYVFEENNRGFLNEAEIKITDEDGSQNYCEVFSNLEGFFTCELPAGKKFVISASKKVFKDFIGTVSTEGKAVGAKIYTKVKMVRKPGYLLDATLSESIKANSDLEEVDAIQGALIEIYNNTSKKEELIIKDLKFPNFQYTLEKGNHYTLMIRKKGFFTKRIEAYVDVDGCILCMDGVSEMSPGVSDNLTAGHQMGTLLANIQLDRAELNKSIEIKNIYYDYNSSCIKTVATKELDKLIFLLKTNPSMIVELGSHTDARGKAEYNQKLSQSRAESAVKYILEKGEIDVTRIKAKGYGETTLVNKCKDGVTCSDAEHQKNRRTELKITGFAKDAEELRSLAQIIEAEQFEIMLQEVLNQEVVEIKAGEKTPEELEKELLEQKRRKLEEEAKRKEQELEKKIETGSDIIKVQKEEVKPNLPLEIEKIPVTKETKVDPFSNSTRNGAIIGETRINTEIENSTVPIPSDYTGFKIEIWKSAKPLTNQHRIFTQHGNIAMDVVKMTKFSYMLGDYKLYENADGYMRENLLITYPEAKVIQYKVGKRLDY